GTLICDRPNTNTDPRRLSSLMEACGSMGLTGQSILDRIAPEYRTKLLTFNPATVTYGEPSTGLTLRVSYTEGAILCYPPFVPPPGSGAPYRPERLEIEVNVVLAADNQLFDESLLTKLSADPESQVTFSHSIPTSQLKGKYEPTWGRGEGVAIELQGAFD